MNEGRDKNGIEIEIYKRCAGTVNEKKLLVRTKRGYESVTLLPREQIDISMTSFHYHDDPNTYLACIS